MLYCILKAEGHSGRADEGKEHREQSQTNDVTTDGGNLKQRWKGRKGILKYLGERKATIY